MRALYELHWLPICSCIEFKILLMVYKCLTDTKTPVYLHDVLVHKIEKECVLTLDQMMIMNIYS